jgi:hypothetical protein
MARRGDRSVKRFVIASLFIAAAAAPVTAAPLWRGSDSLSSRDVVAILRATGFEPVVAPVRGAGVFYVRALDAGDADVRVTVDARNGRILAVRLLGYPGQGYPAPGYPTVAYPAPPRWPGHGPAAARFFDEPGDGFATAALPVPPRGIAGRPPDLARKSAAPPLPRPRPGQAMAAAPQPVEVAAPAHPAPPQPAEPAALKPHAIEFPPVTPLE